MLAGFLDEPVDIDQSDPIKRALPEPQMLKDLFGITQRETISIQDVQNKKVLDIAILYANNLA